MKFAFRTRHSEAEALPADIYLPLVDSLYQDRRTLWLGTIFVTGSVFSTYWKTGEILLLYCALAIVLVACARGIMMYAYFRARPTIVSTEDGRRWEHRYVAGASALYALLGIWCFIAFSRTSDSFAHLVSFSMTGAYVAGIFGRNFANARFVMVQILCTWGPMTAALLIYGNWYHWIFAGLLVPSFLGIKSIADRLRRTLLDAVITSRDMSLLAKRFDTALNNMPHGLLMFDTKRHIVVSNQKLNQQMGLAPDFELKGASLHDLVESIVKASLISDPNAQSMIEGLEARLSRSDDAAFDVDMRNGRTLEFTVQPMENGGMVILVEDITERKIAEAKINQLAHYDALTGLPNRATFQDTLDATLERAATTGESFAILSIDLDHFKEANDTYGHLIGDGLLSETARRMKAAAGEAFAARLGGDEFALIVADGAQPATAAALAERLHANLVDDFQIEGHRLKLSMSIGIAIHPTDGADAKTLMINADAALYRAKADFRGMTMFFEPEMSARLHERYALQEDLRLAIDRGELLLHYQPQLKISGEPIGFEALVRWQCPKRGMVAPATFIPIAEESSLIISLGEWVLREACREAASWSQPLTMAVNISPIQFRHGDLPRLVHAILLETGLAAGRLELEITERVMVNDFSRAVSILNRLKSLGVRIAMDDFGTGYSSLSYLQSFRCDKIKIDRAFICDLETNHHSRAIVRAVIGLGQSLDLPILAEGVETEAQHAILVHEGCDEVQGYLTGRPLPISDYADLVGHQLAAQQNYAVAG